MWFEAPLVELGKLEKIAFETLRSNDVQVLNDASGLISDFDELMARYPNFQSFSMQLFRNEHLAVTEEIFLNVVHE